MENPLHRLRRKAEEQFPLPSHEYSVNKIYKDLNKDSVDKEQVYASILKVRQTPEKSARLVVQATLDALDAHEEAYVAYCQGSASRNELIDLENRATGYTILAMHLATENDSVLDVTHPSSRRFPNYVTPNDFKRTIVDGLETGEVEHDTHPEVLARFVATARDELGHSDAVVVAGTERLRAIIPRSRTLLGGATLTALGISALAAAPAAAMPVESTTPSVAAAEEQSVDGVDLTELEKQGIIVPEEAVIPAFEETFSQEHFVASAEASDASASPVVQAEDVQPEAAPSPAAETASPEAENVDVADIGESSENANQTDDTVIEAVAPEAEEVSESDTPAAAPESAPADTPAEEVSEESKNILSFEPMPSSEPTLEQIAAPVVEPTVEAAPTESSEAPEESTSAPAAPVETDKPTDDASKTPAPESEPKAPVLSFEDVTDTETEVSVAPFISETIAPVEEDDVAEEAASDVKLPSFVTIEPSEAPDDGTDNQPVFPQEALGASSYGTDTMPMLPKAKPEPKIKESFIPAKPKPAPSPEIKRPKSDRAERGGWFWPVPANINAAGHYPGHGGLDFAVDYGTPVTSIRPGKVISAGIDPNMNQARCSAATASIGGVVMNGPQYHVVVEHSDGFGGIRYTEYAHLNPDGIDVKVGDEIGGGQIVGRAGSTGCSTGSHLHLGTYTHYPADLPHIIDPYNVIGGQGY